MGEMADYALIEVEAMEHLRREYFQGGMSEEEAFDLGFLTPLG